MANGSLIASGWGNITKDVKFFNLDKGNDKTPTVRLTVAMNLRRRDNGEFVDKALFWDVVVFGGNAKFLNAIADGNPENLHGAFASFTGEVDFVDRDGDNGSRRYFTVLARDIAVVPKGERSSESSTKSEKTSKAATASSPQVF